MEGAKRKQSRRYFREITKLLRDRLNRGGFGIDPPSMNGNNNLTVVVPNVTQVLRGAG
jgi:hypothetical protein